MSNLAKVGAAVMMGLGIVIVLLAVANLWNIDEQPRWLLSAMGAVGAMLFLGGLVVARRRSGTAGHPPRAP